MEIREPRRASRTGTFPLDADADEVFPLFCPVREGEWLESWNPGAIYSSSGLAEVECVFTSTDDHGEATWLIPHHDPAGRVIHLVKLVPGRTASLLKIEVRPSSPSGCEVSGTYSHTALSPAGEEFVDAFTEQAYTRIMDHWKAALDHYLEHGSPMPGS